MHLILKNIRQHKDFTVTLPDTGIVRLNGPSGVGKSYLSKMLQKKLFLYVRIDTDSRNKSYAANGFPSEWDKDYNRLDPDHLVRILLDRLHEGHAGAIISFPTVHVFTHEKLVSAARIGVTPLVLWGKQEDCVRAAQERIRKKGRRFDARRYERLNEPTFRAYARPEYDAFRVEVFQQDGARYPDEELLARIMERMAG